MQRYRFKFSFIPAFALAVTAWLTPAIAEAGDTTIIPGNNLDVFVDIDTCAQSFTWCSDSGSVGPAAAGNDSVVGVYVHVKNASGAPVGGLPETVFSLSSITNPSPGVTPAFVGTAVCAACIAEQQTGVYRLAARPSFGNWGAGTYVVVLELGSVPGAPVFQTVVPIDIP